MVLGAGTELQRRLSSATGPRGWALRGPGREEEEEEEGAGR